MANELEYQKMSERLDWALKTLKEKANKDNLKISDDVLFSQACEMSRAMFIRSEIAYQEGQRHKKQ